MKTTIGSFVKKTIIYQYFNVKRGLSDEKKALLIGIKKYNKGLGMSNLSLLRRNIHRIEKGLITTPSRPVFAEAFIIETVESLKILMNNINNKESIDWAINILSCYFNRVETTPIIEKAKLLFFSVSNTHHKISIEPYKAKDRIQKIISYDDLLHLNYKRRSIRYYQNQVVPRYLVEKAVSLALQAPSACNRQPFKLRIVDDPELLKKASSLPPGASSFSKNIPMLIFLIGDLSYYFDPRDKHLIYIDGGLFTMNFVLALETLGLSSCIINWPDKKDKNEIIKNLFQLNDEERCVTTISIGFADPEAGVPTSIKKDISSVINYNI